MLRYLILILIFIPSFSLQANEKIRGHYEIVGKLPGMHSLKKVVFEEFFNFGCSHCNNLYNSTLEFRRNEKFRVEFHDIPITFRGQDDAPLRLYYVARKIGKGDLVKAELFKARFIHGVDVFDKGIVNYLARSLGISSNYLKERDSSWINQLLAEGELKARQYGISGTPTVVLQYSMKMDIGRYGKMENFIKQVPNTIQDLIVK